MWTRRALGVGVALLVAVVLTPGVVSAQSTVPLYFIGPFHHDMTVGSGSWAQESFSYSWLDAGGEYAVFGVVFDVTFVSGLDGFAGSNVGTEGHLLTDHDSPAGGISAGDRICWLPMDGYDPVGMTRADVIAYLGCRPMSITGGVWDTRFWWVHDNVYQSSYRWGYTLRTWTTARVVGDTYLLAYDTTGSVGDGVVVNPFPPTPTPVPTPTPTLEPWAGFSVPGPVPGSVGGGYSPPASGPTPTLYPYATSDGVYYAPTPPPGGWPDVDGDGVGDPPGSDGGPVIVITPYVPPTPTPDIPEPQAVAYASVGSGATFDGAGVGSLVLREYDYGCPVNVNTRATGAVRLCVRYIEIAGWSFLGADIPMWPFVGVLVLLVVGFIIRR